ncbi:MAG: thiolase family protein [bacterium]
MAEVFAAGVGMTRFGRFPGRLIKDMGAEAVKEAITDAGIGTKDIQVACCGHTRGGSTVCQRILNELGISGIEMVNIEDACASGSAAFRYAYLAVQRETADAAIAIGVEKLSGTIKGVIPPRGDDLEGAMGRIMPSVFAMIGRRHMHEFGTTPEQFAMVSRKNHKNAVHNPKAMYRKAFTIEEILNSAMVCEPLTLYQCTANADGAAAAILVSRKFLKKLGLPGIRVSASVLSSGKARVNEWDYTISEAATEASRRAYEQAGLGPGDLDVVELHDCFSVAELVHYENLGLCGRGEGGRFIEEKRSHIGGEVAVNPSGGLLSKGHPLGATGVGQVYEAVRQLRGECGRRQVKGAKAALTHTMGGGVSGLESGACSVHILTR